MRGADETSGSLFSHVDIEARIPASHRLRRIRRVVNDTLASLGAEFEKLYRGLDRVVARFTFTMTACDLARLPKLLAA
jgi:hypothetical protein